MQTAQVGFDTVVVLQRELDAIVKR